MGRKAAEKWKARFGADWKLRRGEMRAARKRAVEGSWKTVAIDTVNAVIDFEQRTDRSFINEVRLEQGVEARARRAKQTEAALSDAAAVTVGMFKRRGD